MENSNTNFFEKKEKNTNLIENNQLIINENNSLREEYIYNMEALINGKVNF